MEKEVKIAIYGARETGGLASVLDIMQRINQKKKKYKIIGLIDDKIESGRKCLGYKVIASKQSLSKLKDKGVFGVVCAIGDNKARERIASDLEKTGLKYITLVDPTAILGFNVKIGEGSVIYPNVVINSGTTIGRGVLVNTSCSIDHDNKIHDFVNLSPGVHTAGRVVIEKGVFIGSGASIIPDMTIGRNSTIGAGAVVIEDIPPEVTAVGVPAVIVKKSKGV